ncbi:Protein lin-37-like [Holothuria leucospilota]|uniref:Protein lin-37-like n=1 Tax=Holothuria leucospilota TaxID=206669 RepID=A0A9Q1CM03_HOLLE|nr:Protein lin-37-like [Holothuria leucospilota]
MMANPYMSKVTQSPEVTRARSGLNDVLQNLVDKAEKADESLLAEEFESPKSPEEDSKIGILDGHSSKSSKKHKSSRKRKKDYVGSSMDHTIIEKGKMQHSFVMKLFDRQVDLAQFKASSPLYPVCREWMLNQPLKKRHIRTRTPSPEPPADLDGSDQNDQALRDVYRLPPPSMEAEAFREKRSRDPRIPSPVPQPEEKLDIHADSSQAPSKETLLEGHLTRWREIKNKWKNASDDYQSRYTESYAILKAMYDRQ